MQTKTLHFNEQNFSSTLNLFFKIKYRTYICMYTMYINTYLYIYNIYLYIYNVNNKMNYVRLKTWKVFF